MNCRGRSGRIGRDWTAIRRICSTWCDRSRTLSCCSTPIGVVLFANKEAQERLAPRNGPLEGASLASVLDRGRIHCSALVQSTVEGTEAHDVPLTLPAGGTYLVSFFRLGPRAGSGRSADRAARSEAGHRTRNRARFVESAGAPGDADFRPGSSTAQPAERNEHAARAAAARSRRRRAQSTSTNCAMK